MEREAEFWAHLRGEPFTERELELHLSVVPEKRRALASILRTHGLTPEQAEGVVAGAAPLPFRGEFLRTLLHFTRNVAGCSLVLPAWTLDDELCRRLASGADTPPRFLEVLALKSSPDLERALVQNPNTPFETLGALARRYPSELLQNPVLALLLLEGNELPFSDEVLEDLVKEPSVALRLKSSFLQRASCRHYFATHYLDQLEHDEVLSLARSPESFVRLAVLEQSEAPDVVELLMDDDDDTVRTQAAERSIRDRSPEELQAMAQRFGAGVLLALVRQSSTSPELLQFVAERTYRLHRGFDFVLESVLRFDIIRRLASHPNTPARVLEELAEHGMSFPDIRLGLAANPGTPREALKRVALREGPPAVELLLKHPEGQMALLELVQGPPADLERSTLEGWRERLVRLGRLQRLPD